MIRTIRPFFRCFVAFLLIAHSAFAQEDNGVFGLGERNDAAHARGAIYREVSLFRPAAGEAPDGIVADATLMELEAAGLQSLLAERPDALRLKLRAGSGKTYELELLRAEPLPQGADLGIIDQAGRHRTGTDDGLHYQGIVVGAGRSMAALSVFPNGDVMGLFGNGEGNFNLGKLEDGSGRFVLYNDWDLKIHPQVGCATGDDARVDEDRAGGGMKTTRAMLCNRVRVYWEIANSLYAAKSSNVVTTRTYVTGLFNQFAAMYRNERIEMELASMYIWVTPDEYRYAQSDSALYSFQRRWNAAGASYNADIAHLLGCNSRKLGGIAYVDVLCNRASGYAFSDLNGSFQTVPAYSWDVEVLTHETGHNLGSKHTHWCGWNTGGGGACGAIDNCTTLENTGCPTCSSTFRISNTGWKGSVMSYCHLSGGPGIDLANGFGPLPGNAIRAEVSASPCLGTLIQASLETTPVCNGSGSLRVQFGALNGGTAPYTYTWAGGGSGQTVNKTTPGAYVVTIRDSNGCQLQLSAELPAKANPGNASVSSGYFKMPLCCEATTNKLQLRTDMTADLTACQSVYWIRSTAPVNSFTQAKTLFDTAKSTVFASSSASAAGALLEVTAPVSCASPVAWYYTPVAVNIPHPGDSFISTASVNTAMMAAATRIGSYTSFPDDNSLPVICDPLDTPALSQMSIRVSGYTGRSNRMTLMILDVNNTVLWQRTNLPGNGTYTVTSDSTGRSMLDAMGVFAFDYNCRSASSCVSSTATVSATRKVRYAARAASMTAGCQIGRGIEVSFAQTFCTRLAVGNGNPGGNPNAQIAPNPAGSVVNLSYNAGSSPIMLDITDIVGKRIDGYELETGAGVKIKAIDVRSWAKGVYFFNLHDAAGSSHRMKLVVQ